MGTLTDDLAEVVRLMRKFEQMDGSANKLDAAVGDASHAAYMAIWSHHAEILRNAEDAARYRWLRDQRLQKWVDSYTWEPRGCSFDFDGDSHDIDACIDDAMCTPMHTTPPKLAPEAGLEPATP